MTTAAMRQPFALRFGSAAFLTFWCVIAAFPLVWIAVMSFKLPIDAFNEQFFDVILGPETLARGKGLSLIDLVIGAVFLWMFSRYTVRLVPPWVERFVVLNSTVLTWLLASLGVAIVFLLSFFGVLPLFLGALNALAGPLGEPIVGFTTEHYHAVWVENNFLRNFRNSMFVTAGVVAISLTLGTLAGYGIARSGSNLAFWLLVIALIFRALPHSVLVTGYLPVFVNSAQLLEPILGDNAPTLYGQTWAIVLVLVAINQPFTIWMLRSFFQNIPAELDEAARVDGCTHFGAFRRVIMPVMWPGVITTGLFSFLLAYNDFLVTSLLLESINTTMVPGIVAYFNMETTATDQVEAVAAAVSITAPLFLLVMVFQKQIVSGLTAGAVKG